MDGGTLDIYEDLDNFEVSEKLKVKNEEFQALQEKYNFALEKIQQLEIDRESLQRKIENIERSFSSLLHTARTELNRKESQIHALRKEKDDICFRRNTRYKTEFRDTAVSGYENFPRKVNPFADVTPTAERNLTSRDSSSNVRYRSEHARVEQFENKNQVRWKHSVETDLNLREDNYRQRQFDENKRETRVPKINSNVLDDKNSSNKTKEAHAEKIIEIPKDKVKDQTVNNETKSNVRQSHSPTRKEKMELSVGQKTNVNTSSSDNKMNPKMICISVDKTENRTISLEGNKKLRSESSKKEEKPKKVERRITLSEYRTRKNAINCDKIEEPSSSQGSLIVISVDNKESNKTPFPSSSLKKDLIVHKTEIKTSDETSQVRRKPQESTATIISKSKLAEDKESPDDQVEEITLVTTDLSFSKNRDSVDTDSKSCKQSAGTETIQRNIEKKETFKCNPTMSAAYKKQTFEDVFFDELIYDDFGNNKKDEEAGEKDISEDERLYIDLEAPNPANPMPTNNFKINTFQTSLEFVSLSSDQKFKGKSCNELLKNSAESNSDIKNLVPSKESEPDKIERNLQKILSTVAGEKVDNKADIGEINTKAFDLPKDLQYGNNDELKIHPCEPISDDITKCETLKYASGTDKEVIHETQEKLKSETESGKNKTEKTYDKFVHETKIFTSSSKSDRSSTPIKASTFFGDQKNANKSVENISSKCDSIEKQLESMFKDTSNTGEGVSNETNLNTSTTCDSSKNVKIKAQEMFDLYLASPTNVIPTELEKPTGSKERTPPSQAISGTKKRKSSTPRKSPGLTGRLMKLVGHRIEGFEPVNRAADALEATKLKNALFKEVLGAENVTESTTETADKLKENENEQRNNPESSCSENHSKISETKEEKPIRENKLEYSEELNINISINRHSEPGGLDKKETFSQNDTVQNTCVNDESDIFQNISDSMVSSKPNDNVNSSVTNNYGSTKSDENVSTAVSMEINTKYKSDEDVDNSRFNKDSKAIEISENIINTVECGKQNCKENIENTSAKQVAVELPESEEKVIIKTKEAVAQTSEDKEIPREQGYLRRTSSNSDETLDHIRTSLNDKNVDKQLASTGNSNKMAEIESPKKEKIEILSVVTIKPEDTNLSAILTNQINSEPWLNCRQVDEEPIENIGSIRNKDVIDIFDGSNSISSGLEQKQTEHELPPEAVFPNKLNEDKQANVIDVTLDTESSRSFKEPLIPEDVIDISASPASRQYYSDISSSDGFSNSPPEVYRNRRNDSPCNSLKKSDTLYLNTSSQSSSLGEALEKTKGKRTQTFVQYFCKSIESVDDETVSDSIRSYTSEQGITPILKPAKINFGSVIKFANEEKKNIFTSNNLDISENVEEVIGKSKEDTLGREGANLFENSEQLASDLGQNIQNSELESCDKISNSKSFSAVLTKKDSHNITNSGTTSSKTDNSGDNNDKQISFHKHEKELQSKENEKIEQTKIWDVALLKDEDGHVYIKAINTTPSKTVVKKLDESYKKDISDYYEKKLHSTRTGKRSCGNTLKKRNLISGKTDTNSKEDERKLNEKNQKANSHKEEIQLQSIGSYGPKLEKTTKKNNRGGESESSFIKDHTSLNIPAKKEKRKSNENDKKAVFDKHEARLHSLGTEEQKSVRTIKKRNINSETADSNLEKQDRKSNEKDRKVSFHKSEKEIVGINDKRKSEKTAKKTNRVVSFSNVDSMYNETIQICRQSENENSHKSNSPKHARRHPSSSTGLKTKTEESKLRKVRSDVEKVEDKNLNKNQKICSKSRKTVVSEEKEKNTKSCYSKGLETSSNASLHYENKKQNSERCKINDYKEDPTLHNGSIMLENVGISPESKRCVTKIVSGKRKSKFVNPIKKRKKQTILDTDDEEINPKNCSEIVSKPNHCDKSETNNAINSISFEVKEECFEKAQKSSVARKQPIEYNLFNVKSELVSKVSCNLSSEEKVEKSHSNYSKTCLKVKEKKSKKSIKSTKLSHSVESESSIQKLQECGTRGPRIEIEARIVPHRELRLSILPNDETSFGSERKSMENKENVRGIKRPHPNDSRTSEENLTLTCDKTNNNSIFNDSGNERKNISTSSTDYVIEQVNNNVVNVFITRKKRRKNAT